MANSNTRKAITTNDFLALKRAIVVSLTALFAGLFLSFLNPETRQKKADDRSIKIGMLISKDSSRDLSSRNSVYAAELAIEEFNKHQIQTGRPLARLIVKSCDGNWGSGSKQAVDLIFNDKVNVLAGALNGQNAHLVEQVATKAQMVFLSTSALDPTLSQINIPWFFRSTFNDNQVSSAIIKDVLIPNNFKNVVMVYQEGYDFDLGKKALIKRLSAEQLINIKEISIHELAAKKVELNKETKAIIYFGNVQSLKSHVKYFPVDVTVYLGSSAELAIPPLKSFPEILVPVYSDWSDEAFAGFQKKFRDRFKLEPHYHAVYTYDGISVLLKTIENGSDDSASMANSLRTIHHPGISGNISLDMSGDRVGTLTFKKVN